MENSKDQSSQIPNNNENPTTTTTAANTIVDSSQQTVNSNRPLSLPRTPFTNLSQVDADLALARTLQDQERAYMMLRMNGVGSDHESWETGSYADDDDDDDDDDGDDNEHNTQCDGLDDEEDEEEEDAFDAHARFDIGSGEDYRGNPGLELDPASFPNDEAYARALQDAEDQEMAARLLTLTGINGLATEEEEEEDDMDDHGDNSQDSWDDVDPDELSYEELIALGDVVGTESRGLSADSIASLRSVIYKTQNNQNGSSETCVICRLDYEEDDDLIILSCKHSYHSACITNWLQINKVCPVCSTEVSTSSTASSN